MKTAIQNAFCCFLCIFKTNTHRKKKKKPQQKPKNEESVHERFPCAVCVIVTPR